MKQSIRRNLVFSLLTALLWTVVVRSADRDALLHIVQDQCLPHWREQHDPSPCERIVPPDFALLADRKGGAHLLLIPTQTITGIEDPVLLHAGTPNYFAAAWQARDRLAATVGHPLRRELIGLAINSALARGQDQLHIHIECLQPRLYRALQGLTASIGDQWAPLASAEFPYLARRIRDQDLARTDPFALLANGVEGARTAMADYTIVVAGRDFPEGPGFIELSGRTPTRVELLGPLPPGRVPPGETVLDGSCAIDR
jgi:CDP-diacylglycerol pyrophosphatase